MTQQRRSRSGSRRGPPLTSGDIAKAAVLRRLRDQSGMTQEELAERLGVSQGTLSDWERARKPIPQERFAGLQQLAQELGAATQARAAQEAGNGAGDGLDPPADLRANVTGPGGAPPPGFASTPPATDFPPGFQGAPFDAGAPGGIGVAGLPMVAEVTAAQIALARGPQIIYLLAAQGLESVIDEQAGMIVGARAEALAISLVQAGDVNPYIRRIVELLQVGPVLACVMLHATCALELGAYLRAKAKAQAAAASEPSASRPYVAPPPASAAEHFQAQQTEPRAA